MAAAQVRAGAGVASNSVQATGTDVTHQYRIIIPPVFGIDPDERSM
ncbi:hypothetical protein ACFSGX_17465 [Sphingomonas arantia]|uniref:Uncharacterized protein n=1 Tax=Sphingomonas arantia TaxID=1460676 RepID=A0ABW4U3D3_9SPHN